MRFSLTLDAIYQLVVSARIKPSGQEDRLIIDDDIENLANFYSYVSTCGSIASAQALNIGHLKVTLQKYWGLPLPGRTKQYFETGALSDSIRISANPT